jgi:hypothetical protein
MERGITVEIISLLLTRGLSFADGSQHFPGFHDSEYSLITGAQPFALVKVL